MKVRITMNLKILTLLLLLRSCDIHYDYEANKVPGHGEWSLESLRVRSGVSDEAWK